MAKFRRCIALVAAALTAVGCLVPIGDAEDGDGDGGSSGASGSAATSGAAGSAGNGAGGSGAGGSSGSSGSSGSGGTGANQGRGCALPTPPESDGVELPAPFFDLTMPPVIGTTHTVKAGDDLQAVLDQVKPGDEVVLDAGAKFIGNFALRNLGSAQDWVTIRSSESAALPEAERVTLSDAADMPTLSTPNVDPAVTSNDGAHHYRFVGIRFAVEAGVLCNNIVTVGFSGSTEVSVQPHHLVFDRCIFQGEPKIGAQRGIKMNSAHAAVIDSHFADIKSATNDSDALSMWNGPGPFMILNNHLEASWKTLRIGGEDPSIPALVPSNIAICNNRITKSLSWKKDDPSFAGTDFRIGYSMTIESGSRVLISGNVFDNAWDEDGFGTAIYIAPKNNSGAHTWAIAEHITIAFNIFRNVGGLLWIDEATGNYPDAGIGNIRFVENLAHDVGVGAYGGNGRLASFSGSLGAVSVTDNTVFVSSSILYLFGPLESLVVRDNLFGPTEYGVIGAGAGIGLPALEKYAPKYDVTHNVFVGEAESLYPGGNFFPKTLPEVGFANLAADDYHLIDSSPYAKAASDGSAIGADIDQLLQITSGVAP